MSVDNPSLIAWLCQKGGCPRTAFGAGHRFAESPGGQRAVFRAREEGGSDGEYGYSCAIAWLIGCFVC